LSRVCPLVSSHPPAPPRDLHSFPTRRSSDLDARPARRLPLVREPELHGRARAADGEVAADRLHAPSVSLVRDLGRDRRDRRRLRSEEHTSELQSLAYLVCRLLLEKKKNKKNT